MLSKVAVSALATPKYSEQRTKVFRNTADLAKKPLSQMLAIFQAEADWLINQADKCPAEKRTVSSHNWSAENENRRLLVSPNIGKPHALTIQNINDARRQKVSVDDQGKLDAYSREDETQELKLETDNSGNPVIKISGIEDLFFELKSIFIPQRENINFNHLLRSGVNLLKFAQQHGLDNFENCKDLKFKVRPGKPEINSDSYAVLNCKYHSGFSGPEIEYSLTGTKELPARHRHSNPYSLKITMNEPGQLKIAFQGPDNLPSITINEDGTYEIPSWFREVPKLDKQNLQIMTQFISENNPKLWASIKADFDREIAKLGSNDQAELKLWNPIESFEKMSVPTMVSSLLHEVENIKKYALENRPTDQASDSRWQIRDAGIVTTEDEKEETLREYITVNQNSAGEITNFILNSNRHHSHGFDKNYQMSYNYDAKTDTTEIEKQEGESRKLKLVVGKDGTKLNYGGQKFIFINEFDRDYNSRIDNVLKQIFFESRYSEGKEALKEELKIQADSLIAIVNKLNLKEANRANIKAQFNDSELAYEENGVDTIYRVSNGAKTFEVIEKFDGSREVNSQNDY